jgi:hypothetical protein
MPRIVGQLVDVEHVEPYADRRTGEVLRQAFTQLHVLDGREVFKVRVGDSFGELPKPGQEVQLDVSLRPYVSRGTAGLSITALRQIVDGVGRRVASVPQAAAGAN